MYGQALISPWGTNPYCPPFGVSPNSFLLWDFLREDTVAQRIYRYEPEDGTETLVFDLTMETGDTLFSEGSGEIVLDSITTTTFSDGVVRRVYHFDSAAFIEGVGSVGSFNGGPFYPPNTTVEHCDQLYCFEHDGFVLQGGVAAPYPPTAKALRRIRPPPQPRFGSDHGSPSIGERTGTGVHP